MPDELPGSPGRLPWYGGRVGIGAGIAQVLAEPGAAVAVGDLDAEAATAVARQAARRRRGLGVPLDVTDRESTRPGPRPG